jgi:hypothetical protein
MDKSKKASRLMLGTGIVATLLSVVGSIYLKVDLIVLAMCAVAGLLVFGKFALCQMFSQGWKLFQRKTILGMPVVLFIFYVVVFALLAMIEMTIRYSGEAFDATARNIQSFVGSAGINLIGTIVMWYAGVNDWMANGSEYDARMEFQKKGYSSSETEKRILLLRDQGAFS